ncbi:MAG: hypothetical protein PHO62_06055 [Sulfurimonas sp.]|uniref:hypothetical protein n=1 Tax=Sulfurimonas sp. TaxID=2022749 RepID=UPI002605C41A|nr:hypothetical protein [Sulfurimonas sp.]MDD5372971.1 hypothetical protein [Sulfurimonas sp.]
MIIHSIALSLLLGFELSYYLLIVQTGIVAHYNSDLVTLFPMFAGGVFGTWLSGISWGGIKNPIYKIMVALSLQLFLSFFYPNYNIFTLLFLGLAVGSMAPLGIYLFKAKQQKELFFALSIAYTVGTYFFTYDVDNRELIAVFFTLIALSSALVLKNYRVEVDSKVVSFPFVAYIPLVLWILLDSNLFETLSRHAGLDIWSKYTLTIALFHIAGLAAAYFIHIPKIKQHLLIAMLFAISYSLFYFASPSLLAVFYPFTISYYNVVVFRVLSEEMSLSKLAFMMIFVGWMASGFGLTLALSRILY